MEDLTGKRIGRLYIDGLVPGHKGLWHCKCDCGKEVDLYGTRLRNGNYKSCGCWNVENRKKLPRFNTKHGMTDTVLYGKYCGMKERCYNPHYKYFHRYGGRGIKVCDEWRQSFEAFRDWAYAAGYDDSKGKFEQTIDRIDTDGDYCPENCKWSTQKEQVWNRSIAVHMKDENGEDIGVYDFIQKHGITNNAYVYRKLKAGLTAQEIIDGWNILHNGLPGYMTVKKAQEYYGVCYGSIMNWIYSRKLKAEKHGKMWLIPEGQEIAITEGRNRNGQFLPRKKK